MKKKHSILLIIFFTIVILIGLYFIQHPIGIDKSSLEMELKKFEENKDIKIQKVKTIDNKIIALYTYDNGIGYGTFIKGINGRCLLVSSHKDVGGVSFLYGDIVTNKGKYNILSGKNYDNRIKSIEFTSENNNKLISDISKEDYFIVEINTSKEVFSFLKYDLIGEKGESIKE